MVRLLLNVIYIVVFIVALYKAVGFEGEEQYFKYGMGGWEGLEDEIAMVTTNKSERTPVNVHSFGAVGDGNSDDTQVYA